MKRSKHVNIANLNLPRIQFLLYRPELSSGSTMKASKQCSVLTLFIVLYSDKLVTVNTSPTCDWYQITRLSGDNESCWDCPKCPRGLGLTPQCSSYVSVDVPIHCEECKKGVTYSDVNDISSCKPCSICGENEVTIRECNITHNAICGKCKPGFYRSLTEDCWPCSKCCPDSTPDDLEPQCLDQGLPTEHSCRLDFKTQACADKPTQKSNDKEDVRRMDSRNDSFGGSVRHGNGTVIVRYHIITKMDQNIWIFIGVGVFLCLLVGVIVYVTKNCCLRKRSLIEQEMGYSSAPTDV